MPNEDENEMVEIKYMVPVEYAEDLTCRRTRTDFEPGNAWGVMIEITARQVMSRAGVL